MDESTKKIKTLEQLLTKFKLKVYKIQELSRDNNLVLDLEAKGLQFQQYTLIALFDYISTNYCREFLNIYYYPDKLNDQNKLDIENSSELTLRKEIILNLSKEKKAYFTRFKNDILPLIINVVNLNFVPINKKVVLVDGEKYLNTYKPRNDFSEVKANSDAKFFHLETAMRNILNSEIAYDKWINFLAWKIQYPTIQLPIHWIIQDDGGTGKTELLIGDIVNKLFNSISITQDDLLGGFNFYQDNQQFVVCEEIENFKNYKKIKAQTGAKTISINVKMKPQYTITNYITYIILSNDIKPMKIDRNDRRFNIVGGGKRLIPLHNQAWDNKLVYFNSAEENKTFFDGYHKNLDEELKSLYSYLLSLKLDRGYIQAPIENKNKEELIDINIESERDFISHWNELGFESFIHLVTQDPNLWIQLNVFEYANKTYISSHKLYKLYTSFCELEKYVSLGHKNFTKRIHTHEMTKNILGTPKTIYYNGIRFSAVELINYGKDQSKELNDEPITVVDMVKSTEKEKTTPQNRSQSTIIPEKTTVDTTDKSSSTVTKKNDPFEEDVFAGIVFDEPVVKKKIKNKQVEKQTEQQKMIDEIMDDYEDDLF